MRIFKFILILAIFATAGCRNSNKKIIEKISHDKTNTYRAKKFILEKNKDYTRLIIINPWQGAANLSQSYNLVRRGNKIPDDLDSSDIIFVPLKKIICMSTTHSAMISALGEDNSISGMSGTGFLYNESLNIRNKKGLISDIGYETSLNKELILKISPDLIMMYAIGSESSSYTGKIKELGVNVMFNADYLETDPLGKAEWIKVFGALYCKENLADSIFAVEVKKYNKLQTYVSEIIHNRPKVLLGIPFKDTWYISPGNSFISSLIADAGGEYLWQNTESSVSMPLGIENVYIRALNADYWLNIGGVKSKDEISAIDQRLNELPCFILGNLYNNNKRININDGNDYWESGSVYPHLILKDIATILHPEIFIDKELFYYTKIY